MPSMTVALVGNEAITKRPDIFDAMATKNDWTVTAWPTGGTEAALDAALAEANALVISIDSAHDPAVHAAVPRAPKLRLFHIGVTGTEWLTPALLPPGCTACNSYGHEIGIAEYVMWGLLEADTHLSDIKDRFKQLNWADRYGRATAVLRDELYGKRLGLVGYGRISKEIAKRANAFGMRVSAIASKARPAEPPLDFLGGPEDIDRLCADSDHLVIAASLTPTSANMIDARRLGLMKPGTVIHNVGRARIADEEALFTALKNRQIRGAVLDVWWNYPSRVELEGDPGRLPPAQMPFWELDNVIMTPHCSASTAATHKRRWMEVGDNLDRLARGQPLANFVMKR